MNVVLTPATISKLYLGPDDVVLVSVKDNLSAARAREMVDHVQEAVPNHKVLLVARNISVSVLAKKARA